MEFYTRSGCCLCEDAKAFLMPLVSKYDISFNEYDISKSDEWTKLYGLEIPVVFYEGECLVRGTLHKEFIIKRFQNTFGY
ncbi:MAG: glutaredoxin family protein [Bacilli bacterium]